MKTQARPSTARKDTKTIKTPVGSRQLPEDCFFYPVCVKIVFSQLSAPCSSWLDSASSFQHVKLLHSHLHLRLTCHPYALLSTSNCTVAAWVFLFHHWVLNMKAKRIMGHTTKSNTTRFHTSSHQWKGMSHQIASSHFTQCQGTKITGAKATANLTREMSESLLSCISHLYYIYIKYQ